ncbi:MAG: hypothetical protein ACHP84_20490 [Caulobacterales bacterium]
MAAVVIEFVLLVAAIWLAGMLFIKAADYIDLRRATAVSDRRRSVRTRS